MAWYNHNKGFNVQWSWDFIQGNPEHCLLFEREANQPGIEEDWEATKEVAAATAKLAAKKAVENAVAKAAANALAKAAGTATAAAAAKAVAAKYVARKAQILVVKQLAVNAAAKAAAKRGAALATANIVTAWCPPLMIAVNVGFLAWTAWDVIKISNLAADAWLPECTSLGRDSCFTKAFKGALACVYASARARGCVHAPRNPPLRLPLVTLRAQSGTRAWCNVFLCVMRDGCA